MTNGQLLRCCQNTLFGLPQITENHKNKSIIKSISYINPNFNSDEG